MNVFLDVENAFLLETPFIPEYTFARTEDNSRFATTDGAQVRLDGSNAIPFIISEEADPFVVPSIGIVIDF